MSSLAFMAVGVGAIAFGFLAKACFARAGMAFQRGDCQPYSISQYWKGCGALAVALILAGLAGWIARGAL
jgi:hypothetical protein